MAVSDHAPELQNFGAVRASADMKARETRLSVHIGARIRLGERWTDVHIKNMSAHGLLIKTKDELRVGSYMEVRHGSMIIIGRVVWINGSYSGLRCQDLIDATQMLRETQRKDEQAACAATFTPGERRKDALRLTDQALGGREERVRFVARISQFVVVGVSAAAGCAFIAGNVVSLLQGLSNAVSSALGGS